MSWPPKTVYALVQAVLRDPEVGPPKMLSHAWKPANLTVLVRKEPNTWEKSKQRITSFSRYWKWGVFKPRVALLFVVEIVLSCARGCWLPSFSWLSWQFYVLSQPKDSIRFPLTCSVGVQQVQGLARAEVQFCNAQGACWQIYQEDTWLWFIVSVLTTWLMIWRWNRRNKHQLQQMYQFAVSGYHVLKSVFLFCCSSSSGK